MIVALSLLLAASSSPIVQTLKVDGVERQALIVAPSAGSGPAPLVFFWHGHGGNMRQAMRTHDVPALWPEAIVVYPTGLPTKGITDPEGTRHGWQQRQGEYGDRDLKFFDALLAWVEAHYKVDGRRIYSMGHSNGGRMTYLLWAERGEPFAAFAPSASPARLLSRQFKPKPAFILAGTKDTVVPYRSQEATIDAVRRILGADPAKAKKSGYQTIEPGRNGCDLGTYVFPGPHSLPQEGLVDAVAFLKAHPKR